MELRHLRAFVTVAELGSFRRAARRLHRSQSALSRQIQALEEELDVRLLERGSRREVTLTEVGRIFLADAKQTLDGVEAARQRVREHRRYAQNCLVIANYSVLSARVMPACLKAFREKCPQVEVSIREMNGAESFSALRTGQAQLALAADHGLVVDGGLEAQAVATVPLLAVLPAEHPLAQGRANEEVGPGALSQEVILYQRPDYTPCYSQRLPELFRRANVTPRALRAVDGMGNVLAMVAAGGGVAVLPNIFGDTLPPVLRTRRLRLPESMLPLRLYMVWRPEGASATLRSFLAVAHHQTTAEKG